MAPEPVGDPVVASCKDMLKRFRLKELKDVLSKIGLPKHGKKQELVDKIIAILSDQQDQASRIDGLPKRMMAGKETVLKIVEDTFRQMREPANAVSASGIQIELGLGVKPESKSDGSAQLDVKVRCLCGNSMATGSMIKCDHPRCNVWQHVDCVIIHEKIAYGAPQELPSSFYCEMCRVSRADPFWVTISHPLLPMLLAPSNIAADGSYTVQYVEKTFPLSRAHRELLQKAEYDIQVYCILLDDKVPFRMHWPLQSDMQVNGISIGLPYVLRNISIGLTFLMLESILPFRKVFETLEEQEPSYTFGPSAEEWKMVEDICRLLKGFYHATNVISGSNYPTSNLYFLEIWGIKQILDEQEESKNGTIRSMVNEMKKKFHKYFMESYLTNCIPVVLDPRFKMEHVEFRLKQYFGADAHKHIQQVKVAIKTLFTEYSAEIEDNVDFLSQEPNGEEVVAHDTLSDWDEHIKIKKAGSRNELQRYLDEDFHPRTTDFDILNWWRVNSSRYPTLGRIARDVLAVPASTVASESAFSTCGRVITDHRSSLAPETVEALMCFGDWIKPKSSSEASTSYVLS